MVVSTCNIASYYFGCFSSYWRWLSNSTIYLHTFLMEPLKKYQNILVIVSGVLVFYFIFKIDYLLYAALIVGVGASLIPAFATAINWLWMKLALVLGWINTRILLSIIFYVFLFPISLVQRLFTNDQLKLKQPGNSAFSERDHLYQKEDLENPW